MKRLYFVSDDLDDLESIETELEHSGVETAQIHVLSNNDTGVQNHHLHGVDSFSKLDVVHSALFGIGVGVVCVMFALSFYAMSEAYLTYTWMPAIMLSVVLLGFCTWEGGLWGIQKPNRRFA
ncbi:MAG: NAD/FAD-utilizing enzyme, partial [Alteromonadaceae bacterium]